MKLFNPLILAVLILTACNKPPDHTKIIHINDYLTDRPISGAELVKIHRANFDWSCLCYLTITETQIGIADANGQYKGDISQPPGSLEIRKADYYKADDQTNSVYKESHNDWYFSIFKKAAIKINKNPSRSYDNLVLKVGAVLKDGSVKNFFSSGVLLNYLVGTPVTIDGIGDIQNRITIAQGNNVLLQTDFFVPADSIKEITLSY